MTTAQQPPVPPQGGTPYNGRESFNGGQFYGGMPPRRNNSISVLLIVIIVLLVLLLGGVGAYFIFGNDHATAPAPAAAPVETTPRTVHDTVVVHTQTVVPVAPASTSSKKVRRNSGNSANRASGGDYSWICYTRLSGADLAGLSRSELRVMRNTIYARHGYIFSSADLNNYFSRFSWYTPYTKVVPERELSSVEKHNINLIKAYE